MPSSAAPSIKRSSAVNHGHPANLSLLDLARALAAFWVLAAHLSVMLGWRVYPLSEGRIPVDVFIFLSGFLMFHLLWRQQTDWDLAHALSFYWRRFFRIAPCFYLALVFYIGLRGFYRTHLIAAENCFGTQGAFSSYVAPLTWFDVFSHLIFLHGLWQSENTKVFGPAWTLSLEIQFYAFAPFLVHGIKRNPLLTLLAMFACNTASWIWFGAYEHLGFGRHHFFRHFCRTEFFSSALARSPAFAITSPSAKTFDCWPAAGSAASSSSPLIPWCFVSLLFSD